MARRLAWGLGAALTVLLAAYLRDVATVLRPPGALAWRVGDHAEVALVPSGDAGARTRGAVALLAAGGADRIVFSGAGYGGDDAEQLAHLAKALGAPAERLWVEPAATNTFENMAFTRALLERRGARPECLVVVTSRAHAARAGLVARHLALASRVRVLAVSEPREGAWEVAREGAALFTYRLLGRAPWW